VAQEDSQEKTEQPTERRKQQAIDDGQILSSKDLVMGAVLLVAAFQFALVGRSLYIDVSEGFRNGLDIIPALQRDLPLESVLGDRFVVSLIVVVIFSIPLMIAAIGSQVALGGFHFVLKNIGFKSNRLSPISGFSRMFGMQALIELGKSILKVVALGAVGFFFLISILPELIELSAVNLETAAERVGALFITTLLLLIGGIAVIGALDALIQWRRHQNKMMMSRQELKEENKQTEGSPEVKQRIRQLQREAAERGSVANIGDAQVVITNPQHFAVALHYDFKDGSAPTIVAKGTEVVAARIKEEASKNNIPVLSIPPLARALYYTSEIGGEIHGDLYRAVATVLSFVFQAGAQGEVPDVEIPDAMKFDANGRRVEVAA
jgi:flagellar biosynthetic protein FlhB